MLTSVRIPVSMQRVEEGITRLGPGYLWCQIQVATGRPIRSVPFGNEFGRHRHPQGRAGGRRGLGISNTCWPARGGSPVAPIT